ncbi:MAG: LysR family transcriptional regulator [Desulfuromusa sp.]|nr:LysR family transcriptional regulator [Desulfuromusa sp.]
MSISLRKLEIFVTVATLGSVTGTADKLLLSQSAVSMALADLENQHAHPLFLRLGRKLKLNDRGKMLLPTAQDILKQLSKFEQQLDSSTTEPLGQLRVGASTTIGNYLLPSLMAQFSHKYSKAQIVMQVGNSKAISAALSEGSIDLALIEGPCHLAHLKQYHWQNDELVVIAGNKHPWVNGKTISQEELLNADWIIREAGSGTREVFEQALGAPLFNLSSGIEMGHTEAIKKAVEAGLGVSCLSRLAVQRELEHGWLVEIPTTLQLTRPLSLLRLPSDYCSPLLKACLDMLIPGFAE